MMRIAGALFLMFSTTVVRDIAADEPGAPTAKEEESAVSPETAETGSGSDAEEEARIQFEQGREFFNRGEFEKAAIALRRAFELRPGYRILYYLGWAENETGNYHLALTAFSRYLSEKENTDPPERIAEVEAEVVRLRARVGHLVIKCGLEGATVKVDNETRGTIPLDAAIPVNIGKHEVVVMDGPESILIEVVRIAGGQELTLTVPERKPVQKSSPQRAPVVTSKEAATVDAAPEQASGRPKRVWTFVAYGVAAAAAVGAGITGALALDQESEIWDKCDDDGNCYSEDYDGDFDADTDRLKRLGLTTDILIGAAAAFAIAGTVLLFVEPSLREEKPDSASTPTLRLGPNAFFITGRF